MKQVTNINEHARKSLDITRDEYALCAYCIFRQGYPEQKVPGWCSDSKESIADFVGVTRPGLYKMIERLQRQGLIETGAICGEIRATAVFMDADSGVNKVYSRRKQSLHAVSTKFTDGVNKVNEVNIVREVRKSRIELDQDTPAVESSTFEEKKPNSVSVPPPPPPAAWSPVNPADEIEKMRTDFTCIERFTRESRNSTDPARDFAGALEDFALVIKSEKKTYSKASDLRGHFFNWLPFRQKRKEMFGGSDTTVTTSMRKAKPGESAPLHW